MRHHGSCYSMWMERLRWYLDGVVTACALEEFRRGSRKGGLNWVSAKLSAHINLTVIRLPIITRISVPLKGILLLCYDGRNLQQHVEWHRVCASGTPAPS